MTIASRMKMLCCLALTVFLSACGAQAGESIQSSETSSSESSISSEESSESSEESSEESSVEGIPVSSITLNYSSYELKLKKRVTLTASVLPLNATNRSIRWSSSNSEIVSVNLSGIAYGWEVGSATITCSAEDGSGVYATCDITVSEVFAESIDLDCYSTDLHPRETHQIYPTINPASTSSKVLNYTSEDESVATVSSSGLVTAVNQGTTKIVVSANNGVHADLTVNVTNIPVEGISLRKKTLSISEEGTYSFAPTFYPESASDHGVSYESSDASVASIDASGKLTARSTGNATITATSHDGGFTDTCAVTVVPKGELVKTELSRTQKDAANNDIYGLDCCPSQGKVNFLVIPVWFSDSSSFILESRRETVRSDIEMSFFGSKEDTGWNSVKTYYETLSRGELEIDGTVTSWFNCGLSYQKLATGGTDTLIGSAIAWLGRTYPELDLRDFDSDGNGSIDAISLIYAAPDYISLYQYSYNNLWAYTSWLRETPKVSKPTVNVFFWASYDFLYNSTVAQNRTGKTSYGNGDNAHTYVDAHTYIHEMGHVFGLNDYYDYSSQYSPAAGFSMQDNNVGSHDPYSVMKFGYVDPYIPDSSGTLTIKTFQESGDVILLSPGFNEYGSPFDEYLLLELYSPTGLNELDSNYTYQYSYPQGPSSIGIRLWHVDARLAYSNSYRSFSASQLTTDPCTSLGYVTTAMKNTYYFSGAESISVLGKEYADYNELQLIRNDVNETHRTESILASDDLFYEGDTFSMSRYKKQFVRSGLLNSGLDLGWTFTVNSIKNGQATIALTRS